MISIKKRIYILGIVIIIGVIILSGLLYYFIFTTSGSEKLAQIALSRYIGSGKVNIGEVKGSLAKKFSYRDIVITDLDFLPKDSILQIRKLDVSLATLGLGGLKMKIANATLRIPGFDTVLFYGTIQGERLDVNIYSKNLNINDVLNLVAEGGSFSDISGKINDFDIYVKGSMTKPEVVGTLRVVKFLYGEFFLVDCPVNLDVKLKGIPKKLKLYGTISCESGKIQGQRTAVVHFEPSKIIFGGDPQNPAFNIKAQSKVEEVKIKIALRGDMKKPKLILTSDPVQTQQRLLIMLTTNRSWKGLDDSLKEGQVSADLAKDLIGYFLFTGSGESLAEKLGLREFTIKYDESTKGLGVKKDVSDKAAATYSVEQSQDGQEEAVATHKVGGEYKITDTISIEGRKELQQDMEVLNEDQDKPKTDDEILIKFKKKF